MLSSKHILSYKTRILYLHVPDLIAVKFLSFIKSQFTTNAQKLSTWISAYKDMSDHTVSQNLNGPRAIANGLTA
jgi:hypothetical protein